MNVVKNNWKRGVAGMMLAAIVSAVPANAAFIAGGSVPVINTLTGTANTGLDISSAGTALTLATVYVNNNTAGGWQLTGSITNGGFLRQNVAIGSAAAGNFNAFSAAPDMTAGTNLVGVLGTGMAAQATTAFSGTAAASTLTGPAATAQSTATVDYEILIRGTWAATSTLLAGFYQEKIVLSLVATM
jgi:hypothetical protein